MTSITNYENLPINSLIKKLSDTKDAPIDFNDLRNELLKKDELGNPQYHLSLKEDDDLCIIYYNNLHNNINKDTFLTDLESSCRSLILDKKSLKPLVTQYNRILYNKDTLEFIKDKDWSQIVVQKCYEGTLIVVFYHNDKWYITTRRCLNSQESTWIRNKSYYEMFMEAMDGKLTFDELNKDYCYHFVLIHHKNKNIVTYSKLNRDYKEIFHILTTEKFSLCEIDLEINDKVPLVTKENFENISGLLKELNKQNELDKTYQKITLEGYVMRYYLGEVNKSPFITLKLQTPIYDTIMKLKPNNSNIYQCFLELYQKDKLNDFLPYFTRYGSEVIKRVHISMQNLSKEILDLYHSTRNKNNTHIYSFLSEQFKKCLFEIHGIYISNRKKDFENGVDKKKVGSTKAINVFDIYYYLKNIPSNELRQLFYDRMTMINNEELKFINKNCINTMTQSTLMFKNYNKNE
jgi:hypothetical protein